MDINTCMKQSMVSQSVSRSKSWCLKLIQKKNGDLLTASWVSSVLDGRLGKARREEDDESREDISVSILVFLISNRESLLLASGGAQV